MHLHFLPSSLEFVGGTDSDTLLMCYTVMLLFMDDPSDLALLAHHFALFLLEVGIGSFYLQYNTWMFIKIHPPPSMTKWQATYSERGRWMVQNSTLILINRAQVATVK